MESVAETISMEEAPDNHFRLGVLAFYPAHIVAAGGFIVYIGHWVKVQPNVLSGGEGSYERSGFGAPYPGLTPGAIVVQPFQGWEGLCI